MAAIKRFFEKKKLDAKFKTAGSGQRLDAPSSSERSSNSSSSSKPTARHAPTQAAAQARDAAMARLQQDQQQHQKKPTSKTATWRSNSEEASSSVSIDFKNMNKEFREGAGLAQKSNRRMNTLENFGDHAQETQFKPTTTFIDTQPYICPACGVLLPRNEMDVHLEECLRKELESEPLMMTVTMIHSLNKDNEKVKLCIQTLCKYLQNIIDHPGEEKYRKIRQGNKVFQDKVASVVGSDEFLQQGCGFRIETVINDQNEEQLFYVLPLDSDKSTEDVTTAKDMLIEAEALKPILDRNMQVFEPSDTASKITVPENFYQLTRDEIKREQQNRTKQVEKNQQLRTKAMREGENRKKHSYCYALVRVRLPGGFLIQGTFHGSESIDDVANFVRESLIHDWLPFSLVSVIGETFESTTCSLNSLGLTPSVLFNMTVDADVTAELNQAAQGGKIEYLKDEVIALIQPLS